MERVKLIDICNPKQWPTLSTSKLNENGKYLVYGANGIIGHYNQYNHENETILITCRGATCGNVHISKEKSYINGNAMALDNLQEEKCLKKYLYYFLKQYDMKKVISGSAQPQITVQNLKNVNIQLADINTQKNIVKKLDKVQEIIDIRKKQIEELDQLVKSQFVEMFGDPTENEKKWDVDIINNVAPIQNYKGNFGEKVWLLNLDKIESKTGRIIDYVYENIENVGSSTCTFNEENILYSKLRPYLNKVVIPNDKGYATSELVPLKPNKEKLNKYFLAYLLRSEQFVQYISEKVAGAKMPRVSMEIFREFNVIIPPIDLQNKFAEIVKQIDKQKSELQKSLEEMEKLQESLMNKYFGE